MSKEKFLKAGLTIAITLAGFAPDDDKATLTKPTLDQLSDPSGTSALVIECGENTSEGFVTSGMPERVGGDNPGEGEVWVCNGETGEWLIFNNPWRAGQSPDGVDGWVYSENISGSYPEAVEVIRDDEGEPIVTVDKGQHLLAVASPDGFGFVPIEKSE